MKIYLKSQAFAKVKQKKEDLATGNTTLDCS